MFGGQLALRDRSGQFLVDKLVIKTDTGGIGLAVEIEQLVRSGPVDGTQAHGAGLATTVDHTAMELVATEVVATVEVEVATAAHGAAQVVAIEADEVATGMVAAPIVSAVDLVAAETAQVARAAFAVK